IGTTGDVAAEPDGAAANLFRRRTGGRGIDVGQRHPVPISDKAAGDGETDAARGAGDQDAAGNGHHSSSCTLMVREGSAAMKAKASAACRIGKVWVTIAAGASRPLSIHSTTCGSSRRLRREPNSDSSFCTI